MLDIECRSYHLRQAGNRLKSRKGRFVLLFDKWFHFLSDLIWILTTIRYLNDSIIHCVRHRTSTHYSYSSHLSTNLTLSAFHVVRILDITKKE